HQPATPGTVTCVANAATKLSGKVAPGELISILGSAIAPDFVIPKLDSEGNAPFQLGATSVRIGGRPAPLTYVDKTQINAAVPFEIAGFPTVQVEVLKDSAVVGAFPAGITSIQPGAFAVRNAGNSGLNEETNPALFGTTVAIYATGAGMMQPIPV